MRAGDEGARVEILGDEWPGEPAVIEQSDEGARVEILGDEWPGEPAVIEQ